MIIAMPLIETDVNTGTCFKVMFRGYEISVAVDDSCGAFDSMHRSNIAVFVGETDVTETFGGPWSGAEGLYEAMVAVAGRTEA